MLGSQIDNKTFCDCILNIPFNLGFSASNQNFQIYSSMKQLRGGRLSVIAIQILS